MVKPDPNEAKQPKKLSKIGKDAKAPYFLCCGPDLSTVRGDLTNALSALEARTAIELADVHSIQNPCVIVRGEKEELEKLTTYLVTKGKYSQR